MNSNSYLCKFISEHPSDWGELLLKQYKIKSKREDGYAIFVYSFDCDFSDPLVKEARGIIIDTDSLEVVCWPFSKFGNHVESYADDIDWTTARVQEKVDGSIIKLWYDPVLNKWQFSTNGTIRAEKASIDNYPGLTFGEVILRADNFADIPFDRLDREKTYIFELVSPETQVVIRYDRTSLYHIGTRHNKSGVETEEDIGIKKPASYPLSSLEDCVKAAALLNSESSDENGDDGITGEGFVVVDANWHRVKVKSPDYIMMHRLKTTTNVSKRDAIAMLTSGDEGIKTLCEANPALVPVFKYYEFRLAELTYEADKLAILAKSLYSEYSGDRAAVAKIISRHKLSFIGFRCLDTDKSGSELALALPTEKLARLIPDYAPDDMYSLFLTGEDEE